MLGSCIVLFHYQYFNGNGKGKNVTIVYIIESYVVYNGFYCMLFCTAEV